ncbi:agmatinase family protein [Bdellovibrionota bacterium FG-2]
MTFNPNAAATQDSGIFGLPHSEKEASLIFLPVPWDATTSYKPGTANGPQAILEASKQIDLFDLDVQKPYEPGFFMLENSPAIEALNRETRQIATRVIEAGGIENDPSCKPDADLVNAASEELNAFVYSESKKLLAAGKILGVIGGEHSVPFGAIQAVAELTPDLGVLHFDAHSDTRDAYEGFVWSHASIMRNVLERIPHISRLVQVGIRDMCEQEMGFINAQGNRVRCFTDRELAIQRFEGLSWRKMVEEIISTLPKNVWVSFDIDGLDTRFCPNTGTPVPGGLEFNEANYLLGALVKSGRKIVGFDLNEVAPDPTGASEWDANVGARILYKLSAWTLASHGKCRLT